MVPHIFLGDKLILKFKHPFNFLLWLPRRIKDERLAATTYQSDYAVVKNCRKKAVNFVAYLVGVMILNASRCFVKKAFPIHDYDTGISDQPTSVVPFNDAVREYF